MPGHGPVYEWDSVAACWWSNQQDFARLEKQDTGHNLGASCDCCSLCWVKILHTAEATTIEKSHKMFHLARTLHSSDVHNPRALHLQHGSYYGMEWDSWIFWFFGKEFALTHSWHRHFLAQRFMSHYWRLLIGYYWRMLYLFDNQACCLATVSLLISYLLLSLFL